MEFKKGEWVTILDIVSDMNSNPNKTFKIISIDDNVLTPIKLNVRYNNGSDFIRKRTLGFNEQELRKATKEEIKKVIAEGL